MKERTTFLILLLLVFATGIAAVSAGENLETTTSPIEINENECNYNSDFYKGTQAKVSFTKDKLKTAEIEKTNVQLKTGKNIETSKKADLSTQNAFKARYSKISTSDIAYAAPTCGKIEANAADVADTQDYINLPSSEDDDWDIKYMQLDKNKKKPYNHMIHLTLKHF
ncbi:hypothetical protein [Methanobrevibacter sp.]|uniref:hypothetical protein n=1 Tax=Methanobrevibacter sp. TaxID=66852 RepID=UPI0026E0A661|nr:hypothetical protein [Methanobrevibacter sp.]MDO5860644.1 hypothetical protein [Methanobrevibacter sp.]